MKAEIFGMAACLKVKDACKLAVMLIENGDGCSSSFSYK
jgi:hypothetical protein